MASDNKITRRTFLSSAAAATAAFSVVPRRVLGGPGYVAPSDKINLGYIGTGTQGLRELMRVLRDDNIQVVAVCDSNTDSMDYVDWSRYGLRNNIRRFLDAPAWGEGDSGIRAGRDIGREIVEAHYGKGKPSGSYKGCAAYSDFRELLAKENGLDGVKIMTPDHLHATIAIAAMNRGRHVVMHKPISNVMYETRLAIETARKNDVATHLSAWSGHNSMPQIREWIKAGAIGTLREVHNWINKPIWPQWPAAPKDTPQVPKGLDWDLWLGPAEYRPYHPHYTNAVFRGWYDFGSGILGDMGHYSLLPLFEALELGPPLTVEAHGSFTCEIVDGVSGWQKNDVSFPIASTMRFHFAARGEWPELELYWYDGGMKPPLPEELAADGLEVPDAGMMFVGDSGKILGDFLGNKPKIIPQARMAEFEQSFKPTGEEPDRGADWVAAFKGGPKTIGRFDNIGPGAELVCLGAVALRTGRRLEWESASMQVTNVPEANALLHRKYRQGWEL